MTEKEDEGVHMWRKSIKGFLLDISGVLYNSGPGGGKAIPGSIEAVKRLYAESDVRFLSNESSSTRKALVEKLNRLGFQLDEDHFFTPAPVAAQYAKRHQLRPHLLVHKGVEADFVGCDFSNPNCVIMGDAEEDYTYANLNAAFRVLLESERKLLISLGCNQFYQSADGPNLDVGCFAMALRYAVHGCEHVVIGKPTEEYFLSAVESMGLSKDQVVMIGDDIVGDIEGAQRVGIRGVQVRTGKWRKEWEAHPEIRPDMIADNLKSAVNEILGDRE